MDTQISFVGGGHMARALIGGLRAAGHPAARIRAVEPDGDRADALRRDFGIEVQVDSVGIEDGAGAIVLAVKPQVLKAAVAGLHPAASTAVISIAAGVRIRALRRWIGGDAPLVRAMPNTPALLREGISGLFAPDVTPQGARKVAEQILGSVGATCWVDEESQLDAVTALSGSGPAYFFLLAEALQAAGARLGLEPQVARRLATQTFIGAARMVASGEDVAALRRQVTSPGGTTEVALRTLDSGGWPALVDAAVSAASARAAELGDGLENT